MKRAYLLVFNDATGSQAQVAEFLNKMADISTWRYDIPHAFYFISTVDAKTLATNFRALAGEKGRFIITELVAGNYFGWLTDETWYMVANKQAKPKS